MNPKLIIGLGGTGRDVILRIRRKLFEKGVTDFKTNKDLRFLWIDTDLGQEQQGILGVTGNNEYINQKIKLDRNEKFFATVTPTDMKQIRSQPNNFRNIWEWADEHLFSKVMENPRAISAGAGQTPPVGRFALFFKAPQLLQRLTEIVKDMKPGIKVILTGSLAGGTGAGMCLDVAAMLRCGNLDNVFEKVPNVNNATIWGYYLMPEALCHDPALKSSPNFDTKRVLANGYAMLQELERFSLDRTNKAAILSRGGHLKATWKLPHAPERAQNVPFPIYDSIFLFDGHGNGDETLNRFEDCNELVATLIAEGLEDKKKVVGQTQTLVARFDSAEDNAARGMTSGHIQTVPPGALAAAVGPNDVDARMRDRSTKWADVFSYNFSAAGMSRITFEAPRLRLMAAYRMTITALECWLGKRQEDQFDTGLIGDASLLEMGMYDRMAQHIGLELNGLAEPGKPRQTPVNPDKWNLVKRLGAEIKAPAVSTDGGFTRQYLSAKAARDATVSDVKASQASVDKLSAMLATAWFDEPETNFDKLAVDLVQALPLSADYYAFQGGLAALNLAAGLGGKEGALRALLRMASKTLGERAAQHQAAIPKDADIERACKLADLLSANYSKISGSLCTRGSTKRTIKTNREGQAAKAGELLKKYMVNGHFANVFACLKRAIDRFLESKTEADRPFKQRFDALESAWQSKHKKTLDLIDGCRDDLQAVLRGLKSITPDACTVHVGFMIQRRDDRLWEEINCAFETAEQLRARVTELQQKFVELAKSSAGTDENTITAENVLELASHKNADLLDRTTLVNEFVDSAFDATLKEKMLDRHSVEKFLRDQKCREKLDEIFKEMGGTKEAPDDLWKWLETSCRPRANLPPPNAIFRQTFVGGGADGFAPPNHTHSYAIGINRDFAQRLPGFQLPPGGDKHTTLAIQMEIGIPLPNFLELKESSKLLHTQMAELLHFMPPKTAYPPIHEVDVTEGEERLTSSVHALLAIILGHIRPLEMGTRKCFALKCSRMQDGDFPYNYIKSVGDLIYHLGESGRLKEFKEHLGVPAQNKKMSSLDALKQRNEDTLRKLTESTLIVLIAIVRYNKKWGNKQSVQFSGAQAQPLSVELGPQTLVLNRLEEVLEQFLSTRFKVNMNDRRIVELRSKVGRMLHHVSEFVPIILKDDDDRTADDGGHLLALRTVVTQSANVPAEEDLIDRTIKNPVGGDLIHDFVALKAPQFVYTTEAGALTLSIHRAMCGGEDGLLSMSPFAQDQGAEHVQDWSDTDFIDERICRGEATHAQFEGWSGLVPRPPTYQVQTEELYGQEFRIEDIQTLLSEGRISASTNVYRIQADGNVAANAWRRLGDVPELSAFVPKISTHPGVGMPPPPPPVGSFDAHISDVRFAVAGHNQSNRTLTVREIKALVLQKKVGPNTQAWRMAADTKRWQPAQAWPELTPLFVSAQAAQTNVAPAEAAWSPPPAPPRPYTPGATRTTNVNQPPPDTGVYAPSDVPPPSSDY